MIIHKAVFQHHGAATEKGRYALNGAVFTRDGLLTTDGRRLHVRYYVDDCGQPVNADTMFSDGDTSAMVKPDQFDNLTQALFPIGDPVVIDFLRTVKGKRSDKHPGLLSVTFTPPANTQDFDVGTFTLRNLSTGATVTVPAILGQFPDYRRVLPIGRGVRVGFDAAYIAAAAKCAQGPIEHQAVVIEIHGPTIEALRAGIAARDWEAVEKAATTLRGVSDTGFYLYGRSGCALVMPIDGDSAPTDEAFKHGHTMPAAILSHAQEARDQAEAAELAAWADIVDQAEAEAHQEAADRITLFTA